jgi:hypothetical protein
VLKRIAESHQEILKDEVYDLLGDRAEVSDAWRGVVDLTRIAQSQSWGVLIVLVENRKLKEPCIADQTRHQDQPGRGDSYPPIDCSADHVHRRI